MSDDKYRKLEKMTGSMAAELPALVIVTVLIAVLFQMGVLSMTSDTSIRLGYSVAVWTIWLFAFYTIRTIGCLLLIERNSRVTARNSKRTSNDP